MTRVVVVVAVTATVLVSCARDEAAGRPGRPAPTFTAEDVRAGRPPVTLTSGKPAVVNFLAAWCTPCRKELPRLVDAHRRYGDEIAFVGVDVKDSRSRAVDLLEEFGVDFPVGYDPQSQIADRFRVQAMPTTFFLDAGGRITAQVLGELDAEELTDGLRKLREP